MAIIKALSTSRRVFWFFIQFSSKKIRSSLMDDPAKKQREKLRFGKRSLRRYDPDQVIGIRHFAHLSAAAALPVCAALLYIMLHCRSSGLVI